ncbi:MAG: 5-(carboxyamino)imidazole ribonucleotide mutase [Candidatus Poribacteria bacterium]|nr:MAG: 5-(carboxyamino)imidazole ribonucleotide mutase [Candidatus Poribacteria bacterium]
MSSTLARVGILMGSDSDLPTMSRAAAVLEEFGVPYEIRVMSAHRTPELVRRYVESAEERGLRVLICGAGRAAHLAGVAAAHTTLPVLGVPIEGGPLNGVDALYSTVQMPPGIPVATFSIGTHGAQNAALFAVALLALSDPQLAEALKAYRRRMAESVQQKDAQLQEKGWRNYP